jgi:hypothetical protein
LLKLCLAIVPVTLLATTSLASAQARGSYRATCFDIQQDGPILNARCRRPDGSVRSSSIDLRRCRSGVANTYGHLTCGGY